MTGNEKKLQKIWDRMMDDPKVQSQIDPPLPGTLTIQSIERLAMIQALIVDVLIKKGIIDEEEVKAIFGNEAINEAINEANKTIKQN